MEGGVFFGLAGIKEGGSFEAWLGDGWHGMVHFAMITMLQNV